MASIDVELDEVLDGSSDWEIKKCFSRLTKKLKDAILKEYGQPDQNVPDDTHTRDLIEAFNSGDKVQFEIVLNRIWPGESLETAVALHKAAA